MLRAALLLLMLMQAVATNAQEVGAPPAVSSQVPTLWATGDAGEGTALVPDVTAEPSATTGAGLADSADAGTAQAIPAPFSDVSSLQSPHGRAGTDLVALVAKAHPVVQAVMGLLAAAIFGVVTICLFKTAEFIMAFLRLRRTADAIAATPGLSFAVDGNCPLAAAARAALEETAALTLPLTADLRASARDRLDLSLARIEAGAVKQLRTGTGFLASVGAVAPFVGLFGTVFGIMNSFLAIADTGTTNLSVVAPGIAEALLATGIGLAAAIPAVLLYNHLLRQVASFRHRLADGTAEVLRRFSLELDARMMVDA